MSIDSKVISVLNQINSRVANNESYNNRGSWLAQTEYAINDVVTTCYAYWVCKTAHTSDSSMVMSHWEHLGVYSMADELKPSLAGIIWTKESGPVI